MTVTEERPNVYVFGPKVSEGNATMKQLLGGKGANLAEMSRLGLNVPAGLTITTEVCSKFHKNGGKLPDAVWQDVLTGLKRVEEMMGKKFADNADPLLLSVRSGAAVSMPGMMDTVLNLGLNDAAVQGLAAKAGKRFAWDSYRRFLDMYACVVLNFSHSEFEKQLSAVKAAEGAKFDADLSAAALENLVGRYKQVYVNNGHKIPTDPLEQLREAACAVFRSWESERAVVYRKVNGIKGLVGTAVNVQSMVFGNLGPNSGTGVLFTRNPSTGENKLYGEYLINAQGEDVVAGIRTPNPIALMEQQLPEAYALLCKNCDILEREFQDMQDIEFTVQEGTLFMLQCRIGKRTGAAAMKIACDFVDEKLTTIPRAVKKMIEARHLDQLLHPFFKSTDYEVLGKGLAASPGAAVGEVVFSSAAADDAHKDGKKVILVRHETSADDVKGMFASEGVLTQLGGMTSHAAVVARGWGKPCIAGCGDLDFADDGQSVSLGGVVLKAGDLISLNGSTGEVIKGAAEVTLPVLEGDVLRVLKWADEHRKLGVCANADTAHDAKLARANGAEGIGLARTEHMFFATNERLDAVRAMIVTRDPLNPTPEAALKPIEKFQRDDFVGIFTEMDGLPVTIRLLDPPLHEFLPTLDNTVAVQKLADDVGMSKEDVQHKLHNMTEANPMLGLRGCRLGVAFPELVHMQVRAIISAALTVKAAGKSVMPQIMVPLVSSVQELRHQVALIRAAAEETMAAMGSTVEYRVGSMIETPRAALMAGEIAQEAEFFSFGTNDLTQMTYGLSRDDAGTFLPTYLNEKLIPHDPFQVLDSEGVGQLIELAIQRGRAVKPNLSIAICGEQGGDPESVAFCGRVNMNYVSCSPFRVPIARLAAAQAAIKL